MMGADSCQLSNLCKVFEVNTIISRGEGGAIVREIGLRNDAKIATVSLKLGLRLDGLVRVQVNLLGNKDVAGGVVDKDCTTGVLLLRVFLAEGMLQSSPCGAHKMVN